MQVKKRQDSRIQGAEDPSEMLQIQRIQKKRVQGFEESRGQGFK
jgi:hypothetical protein